MGTLKVKNIKLLYKTYSAWDRIKNTYKPLKGEMCICEVQNGNTKTILFKVGDGNTFFSALPWGSALASDVYAWAKKENLDWDDLSAEFKEDLITYLSTNYISVDKVATLTTLNSLKTISNEGKVLTIVNGDFAMIDLPSYDSTEF